MRRRSFSMAGRDPHGGSPQRIQARAGGRWTHNPSLGCEVCPGCCAVILPRPPWEEGSRFPDACTRCGAVLCFATCTHGDEERFPDPAVMARGGYAACGAPAVAMTITGRRPRCAEHVDEERGE